MHNAFNKIYADILIPMKNCQNCNIPDETSSTVELFKQHDITSGYHKDKINIIIKLMICILIFGIIFHYFYLLE